MAIGPSLARSMFQNARKTFHPYQAICTIINKCLQYEKTAKNYVKGGKNFVKHPQITRSTEYPPTTTLNHKEKIPKA